MEEQASLLNESTAQVLHVAVRYEKWPNFLFPDVLLYLVLSSFFLILFPAWFTLCAKTETHSEMW